MRVRIGESKGELAQRLTLFARNLTHAYTPSSLPVADAAESVDQSADSLGEVRIERDRSSVVRDRFLYLTRVLHSVGEVGKGDILAGQMVSGQLYIANRG